MNTNTTEETTTVPQEEVDDTAQQQTTAMQETITMLQTKVAYLAQENSTLRDKLLDAQIAQGLIKLTDG